MDAYEPADIKSYQHLIGFPQHLSVCTRPDITFAVVRLLHYLQKSSITYLEQAIHILLNLKRIKDLCIRYSNLEPLHGYCDRSYMADLDDSKSYRRIRVISKRRSNRLEITETIQSHDVNCRSGVYGLINGTMRSHLPPTEDRRARNSGLARMFPGIQPTLIVLQ